MEQLTSDWRHSSMLCFEQSSMPNHYQLNGTCSNVRITKLINFLQQKWILSFIKKKILCANLNVFKGFIIMVHWNAWQSQLDELYVIKYRDNNSNAVAFLPDRVLTAIQSHSSQIHSVVEVDEWFKLVSKPLSSIPGKYMCYWLTILWAKLHLGASPIVWISESGQVAFES